MNWVNEISGQQVVNSPPIPGSRDYVEVPPTCLTGSGRNFFFRSIQSVWRANETDALDFLGFAYYRSRIRPRVCTGRGSFHFPGLDVARVEAGRVRWGNHLRRTQETW